MGRFSLPESPLREPDGVGSEDCLRKLRTVDSENTPLLPLRALGGGTASLSPFRRSPRYAYGSLPPLLGQSLNSCPATKGAYPLGSPADLCPTSWPQINQKRLCFRVRSPHLFGKEPCPLRLQTVFSSTALRLSTEKVDGGMA
jgi:hypothetical protein